MFHISILIIASPSQKDQMIKSRIDFKNDHFIVHNKYLHCGDRNVQHFVGLKANVSQENRVLCHVLRQFSIVLIYKTVHSKQDIFWTPLNYTLWFHDTISFKAS